MTQIDFSDRMLTNIDRQVPLLGGGPQSDWITAQIFGYPKHMTAIEKLSFGLDLTDDILRGVLDGWKPLRERPRTGLIAARWVAELSPQTLTGISASILLSWCFR